jgi:hypothetical protein
MKKSYLIEIIREEILAALNEETIDVQGDPNRLSPQQKQQHINKARQATKDRMLGTPSKPVEFVEENQLEEDLLNETPIYNVEDEAGFQSALEKFRKEEVSKNKALNVLLTKLEDEGTVDTNSLSKEYGVDTATFNNTEIRKFLNRPEDEAFVDKKTGEELIDFTPFLGKSNKPRGPKATEKPTAEPKAAKTTEPKKATLTKGDDGFDNVSYSKPKTAEPKVTEPKTTDTDKASTMASKTPKLDKLAGDQDALLKTQRDVKDKMQSLAQQLQGAKEDKRNEIVDELKKLNKLNGELQKKIDKLF